MVLMLPLYWAYGCYTLKLNMLSTFWTICMHAAVTFSLHKNQYESELFITPEMLQIDALMPKVKPYHMIYISWMGSCNLWSEMSLGGELWKISLGFVWPRMYVFDFLSVSEELLVDRNVHRIMKMLGANGSGRVVINFNIALLQCKYGLIFECVWGGVALPTNCYLSLVEGYSGIGADKKEITLLQCVCGIDFFEDYLVGKK